MTIPVNILQSPTGQSLVEHACGFVSADGRLYPVVDGVPVLLDAEKSLFSPEEVARRSHIKRPTSMIRQAIEHMIPERTLSVGTAERYTKFARRIRAGRVLIIGGGRRGHGSQPLFDSALEVIETDVYLSPRVDVVCDGHDLPFRDEVFDGVILQAVLEHVIDPQRVVAEAYRVLRPEGLIYAETPFLQGVHEGAFDFTRWTELGHRRLFRMFCEIERGVVVGPATSLVWAISYLARSLPRQGSFAPRLMEKIAIVLFFWIKYLDHVLVSHPGATDGACGTYFMGAKSLTPVSDADIVRSYRGTVGRPDRRDA